MQTYRGGKTASRGDLVIGRDKDAKVVIGTVMAIDEHQGVQLAAVDFKAGGVVAHTWHPGGLMSLAADVHDGAEDAETLRHEVGRMQTELAGLPALTSERNILKAANQKQADTIKGLEERITELTASQRELAADNEVLRTRVAELSAPATGAAGTTTTAPETGTGDAPATPANGS